MQPIPLTREGYDVLKEELRKLKSEERPRIIQEIADARAHGDISENAEYHAAKDRQSFIEARIADLDDKLSRAHVIDPSAGEMHQVRFGAYVTVSDDTNGGEKTLRIVGDLEADITKNKISISSPIAKAMLGKRVDDLVEVQAPKGTVEYTITGIRY